MRRIGYLFFLFCFMVFPMKLFALEQETEFYKVSEVEKYYKTTTRLNPNTSSFVLSLNDNISFTEEISKEEYDAYHPSMIEPLDSMSVETTYKKLTTTILSNGSYYRYKATLHWKNMPKVRSYDTLAIGFNASVKPRAVIYFEQTYCPTNGDCRTLKTFYPQIYRTGVGATFKVPTGDLKSLDQVLYFDVQKAVNETIISQKASGDYAHAVKSISEVNALKYSVSNSGIDFDSSVLSYYDEIPVAQATWKGTW